MKPVVVALCVAPLLFALPTLNEPWGNSEESLNAAIWSLGAKNLLLTGAGRGTVVLPHGGTRGDGVYAHHPPLVVWLTVVPVALGGWEGGPRLLALLCGCVSLVLLHRLLRRHFEPRAALLGLAAAALSVFALRYGRLLTTLTLAAPLYLGLLCLVLEGRRRWAPVLVALLVLSSWDGVIGAAVVILVISLSPGGERAGVRGESEGRTSSGSESAQSVSAAPEMSGVASGSSARPPHPGRPRTLSREPPQAGPGRRVPAWGEGVAFMASLAFVAWHLIAASGGLDDLLWQFRWRSSGDEVTWARWLTTQALHVGEGLGPLSLAALLAAPFLLLQEKRLPFLLLAAPGAVMLVVFRQGAVKHEFWGYLLLLPAAFAVAHLSTRLPRVALPLVALQLAAGAGLAAWRLSQEHGQNQLGQVAKTLPRNAVVPVFARRSFHPYVSWYAGSRPLTVRTLTELGARTDSPVLVDATHARALGCTVEPAPAWQVLALETVRERCAPIVEAAQPSRQPPQLTVP